jgi:hypothetical protein
MFWFGVAVVVIFFIYLLGMIIGAHLTAQDIKRGGDN